MVNDLLLIFLRLSEKQAEASTSGLDNGVCIFFVQLYPS